ncbi:MAG: DNA polymerase III subunit gamma/tau [Ilumatobacteraceae bacterium]
MATQSLYRRYRPRRFSEVKGQEHVVRALRNAVINHREGQAYLFSGPRGTGKTTSARILAKVLNCERPVDGEPCCECDSCLSVERGTSYDVHELDAASNNGVDAIRDIIDKASLGTPGRHKVYILDEVHMLSKGAEAALLKTLEEPPPHVVFVLATTDPQKVSETIRSRTQHLQFHLLPMDVMEDHVRWLAADAGIDIGDDAIQSVLRQGGGSARDTISALELVASGGGEPLDITPLDEFVEAFIAHDTGRALSAVAHSVQRGLGPRTLAEDVVRHLRDCFLAIMAPELVQLPAQRADEVAALAQRLGAGGIVRAMERLGEVLVEMRHAPDPRVLLEVALVQLTHEASSVDIGVLLERIERLEHQVAQGAAAAPASRPVAIDPATGRAMLGGRARRESPAASGAPAPASIPAAASESPAPPPAPAPSAPAASSAPRSGEASSADIASAAAAWHGELLPNLKGMARAMFSPLRVLGERDGALAFAVSRESVRDKCAKHLPELQAVIADKLGVQMRVSLVVTGEPDHELDNSAPIPRPPEARRPEAPPPVEIIEDDDIDVTALEDVPPEAVQTPEAMLQDLFPGSSMIEEQR